MGHVEALHKFANGTVDLGVLDQETVVTFGRLDVDEFRGWHGVVNRLLLGRRVQHVRRHR